MKNTTDWRVDAESRIEEVLEDPELPDLEDINANSFFSYQSFWW